LHINEKKREIENQHKLVHIKTQLDGLPEHFELVKEGRKLVCEGEIKKVVPENKPIITEGHFFLFNDLFLFTKQPKKQLLDINLNFAGDHQPSKLPQFHVKHIVPLAEALIHLPPDDSTPNAFELVQIFREKLMFATNTPEQKEQLLTTFKDISGHLEAKKTALAQLSSVSVIKKK